MICPPSMLPHAQKVLRGEYDLAYEHPGPVIVDIGANIGSFALWAVGRWPGCQLHCYEPLPANFDLLRQNLAHLPPASVSLHPFAIGHPGRRRLFLGKNNCGEASFFNLGEQASTHVDVDARAPDVLPRPHILKIDAEGSEIEILSGLGRIECDIVLLEYHSESNRRKVDELLTDYVLAGGQVRGPHRGVFKYAHRRFFTDGRSTEGDASTTEGSKLTSSRS
jgi:FkbM family methyltransferase